MRKTSSERCRRPRPRARGRRGVGRSLDNLCQIIRDLKTGQPYTIQSAIPPINPAAQKYVIHATGTVASWITFCWSGPILSNVHWYYVMRGPRCPRPAAKP